MTRLYINPSQAKLPFYSPQYTDFDTYWGPSYSRCYQMSTRQYNGSISEVGCADIIATSPMKGHMFSAMTPPLQACTISGTIKGQLVVAESDAAADMMAYIVVRLLNADLTHKAMLFNSTPGALTSSEFNTGLQNRQFPWGGALSVNTETATTGDRIVADFGYEAFNSGITSYTASYYLNDTVSGTDLPEDETTTLYTDNPWIEFSTGLLFVDGSWGTHSIQEGEGAEAHVSLQVLDIGKVVQSTLTGQIWPRGSVDN